MMKNNKSIQLMVVAMLMLSFSIEAMDGIRPVEVGRPTNEAGVDSRRNGEIEHTPHEMGIRVSAHQEGVSINGASTVPVRRLSPLSEGDEHEPVETPIVETPHISTGDADFSDLTPAEEAGLKVLAEKYKKNFSQQAPQDLETVIAEKKEELTKLQEQIVNLEKLQNEEGAKHIKITHEIAMLQARIAELSGKVLEKDGVTLLPRAPKKIIKKPGLLARLFKRKKSTSTEAEEPQQIKPGFFDGLAVSKVLKNDEVKKALDDLPTGNGYPAGRAVVNSIVVFMRMSKNPPTFAEILETILPVDRSKLTLEEEEKYKKLITDVYDALVRAKKIRTNTTYSTQVEDFKSKLSVIVMGQLGDDQNLKKMEKVFDSDAGQEIVNEIIQQLRAGNSPQQVVSIKQIRLNALHDTRQFPEANYRALVDTVLEILIRKNALTVEAGRKILKQLQEREDELSDAEEAWKLTGEENRKKRVDKKVELGKAQEKLKQAEMAQVIFAVAKRKQEEQRAAELKMAQDEVERIEAAKPKRMFSGLKAELAKKQREAEEKQKVQEAAKLQAQEAAAQQAAAQAQAEAARLQAEVARLQKQERALQKKRAKHTKTAVIGDDASGDAGNESLRKFMTKPAEEKPATTAEMQKESFVDQLKAAGARAKTQVSNVLQRANDTMQKASEELTGE